MTLSQGELGKKVEIINIELSADLKRRLGDMGFAAGMFVTPIARKSGNLVVSVCGSRIAISETIADGIIVR